jgi:uncharacterized iron-regulated protein
MIARHLPQYWRRAIVATLCMTSLTACGIFDSAPRERIVEVATGREVARAELLAAVRASDYTLLGELHDNARHHAARGDLLADLGPSAAVVAEQLPRGKQVTFTGDLLNSLTGAGFDAKGWQWPVHEALFAGIERSGAALAGADVARELARRIAREGDAAVPPELRSVLDASPLSAPEQAAMDADLVDGHCGQLSGAPLQAMRSAQRVRDASMWLAMRESRGAPVVLLAGNGHVRLDFGVPRLIAKLQPAARVVSVGLTEPDAEVAGAPFTYLWITARAQRKDPCEGFAMPKR